ncbi:MAG: hypothetical protein R3F48_01580 [Candidatus Zixiibacteriota bacterium]
MNDKFKTVTVVTNTISALSLFIVMPATLSIPWLFVIVPIIQVLAIILTLLYLKSLDQKNIAQGKATRDACVVINLVVSLFIIILSVVLLTGEFFSTGSSVAAGFVLPIGFIVLGPALNIFNIVVILRIENKDVPGEHVPWKESSNRP